VLREARAERDEEKHMTNVEATTTLAEPAAPAKKASTSKKSAPKAKKAAKSAKPKKADMGGRVIEGFPGKPDEAFSKCWHRLSREEPRADS
jgi:hypothetical protein